VVSRWSENTGQGAGCGPGVRPTGRPLYWISRVMSEYDKELFEIVAELNRAAPSQEASARGLTQSSASLDTCWNRPPGGALPTWCSSPASAHPADRRALERSPGQALDPEDVRGHVLPLLEAWQLEELQKKKSVISVTFARVWGGIRVNIHHQRGTPGGQHPAAAFPDSLARMLHLPPALAKLAERRQGLVLVTGPTGCGKTSTLAALIDIVNTRRAAHVVTIEDHRYQHANRAS